MEASPAYKRGDVIETRDYINYPLSLKMMKILIEEVEDVKNKSGINSLLDFFKTEKRFFIEKDFHEELQKIGKSYCMKYNWNIFNPASVSSLCGNGFIGTSKKDKATAWENYDKHKIYGSTGREFTYFSTSMPIALNYAFCKSSDDAVVIEIDVGKLSRKRKIFSDLEAYAFFRERKKTFIVMGGIPKESIKKVYHMKKIQ